MNTLPDISAAVIEQLEANRFDEALSTGAKAGVFDDLLAKAEADLRAGKTIPLDDIIRDC